VKNMLAAVTGVVKNSRTSSPTVPDDSTTPGADAWPTCHALAMISWNPPGTFHQQISNVPVSPTTMMQN
jgi:hypothetical protein